MTLVKNHNMHGGREGGWIEHLKVLGDEASLTLGRLGLNRERTDQDGDDDNRKSLRMGVLYTRFGGPERSNFTGAS